MEISTISEGGMGTSFIHLKKNNIVPQKEIDPNDYGLSESEEQGFDACLDKTNCAKDEEGILIRCEDCPGNAAWEKILSGY